MTNTKHVLMGSMVSLALLGLLGCNGPDPAPGTTEVAQTQTVTSGAPVVAVRTAVIKDGSDRLIAYVVGLQDFGKILLYLPDQDLYVRVDATTGVYASSNVQYTGAGCTGTAFLSTGASSAWYGQMNKAVVFDGVNYFKVTGNGYSATSNSNRGNNGTTCNNATSAITGGYSVTDTTQPYDFTTIAPLSITYQE